MPSKNVRQAQGAQVCQGTNASDVAPVQSSLHELEWRIDPSRLQICMHADCTPWQLGAGANGRVISLFALDVSLQAGLS